MALLQEIRRRHRYLAHLPLTCEFSICELALQSPVLSKETLDTFAGENMFPVSGPEFSVAAKRFIVKTSPKPFRRLGEEKAPEAEESEGREAP